MGVDDAVSGGGKRRSQVWRGGEIRKVDSNIFKISKHLLSLRLNFNEIRQVEPPSPILKDQKISADQMSDDPLSRDIYMIMGETSDAGQEGFFVCAWSARTGLSYVGTPSSTIS